MVQELLTEGPPISRTDAAFCNSDPREASPKALSNVIKVFGHLALLYELELFLLFLILLLQKQTLFSPKAADDAGKAFSQKFGDREICPDDRRLGASFSPYARLNVNHVRDYIHRPCSADNKLIHAHKNSDALSFYKQHLRV
jgi:hypothetical protein